MFGDSESEVCIAKWGNADQGSGEGWHDVALVGRWREVLKLDVSDGRGAGNGAIGNADKDTRGRCVAVVNGDVLAEVDARGTGVS